MSLPRAQQALEDLQLLDVQMWPHWPLLASVWRYRDTMSAYDASYVTLAESLGVPLLTAGARLAAAARAVATCEIVEVR